MPDLNMKYLRTFLTQVKARRKPHAAREAPGLPSSPTSRPWKSLSANAWLKEANRAGAVDGSRGRQLEKLPLDRPRPRHLQETAAEIATSCLMLFRPLSGSTG